MESARRSTLDLKVGGPLALEQAFALLVALGSGPVSSRAAHAVDSGWVGAALQQDSHAVGAALGGGIVQGSPAELVCSVDVQSNARVGQELHQAHQIAAAAGQMQSGDNGLVP